MNVATVTWEQGSRIKSDASRACRTPWVMRDHAQTSISHCISDPGVTLDVLSVAWLVRQRCRHLCALVVRSPGRQLQFGWRIACWRCPGIPLRDTRLPHVQFNHGMTPRVQQHQPYQTMWHNCAFVCTSWSLHIFLCSTRSFLLFWFNLICPPKAWLVFIYLIT